MPKGFHIIFYKEGHMDQHAMHYDTLMKVTTAISQCKEAEDVALLTAESVKTAFNAKGCAVFLVDKETRELGLMASSGLSQEYLSKGPIHFMQDIKEAKDAVPIAIFDVMDDPRIQYPEAAQKEEIASLLGVPIITHNKIIGALRLYTGEPWEFTHHDIVMVQAVALICGMAMDACRMYRGYKTSIEILKEMRSGSSFASHKWTPFEGVPKSVTQSICNY